MDLLGGFKLWSHIASLDIFELRSDRIIEHCCKCDKTELADKYYNIINISDLKNFGHSEGPKIITSENF